MPELSRCPVEVTLSVISDKWKVLIIRELLDDTKRFGELRKALGNVSTKVLTANLRAMENDGLITRTVYPEVPPRVEYALTKRGFSLKPVLTAMIDWGVSYKYEIEKQTPLRSKNGKIIIIAQALFHDIPEILDLQHLAYQSEAELLNNYDIPPLKQTVIDLEKEFNNNTLFLKALDEKDRIIGSVRGKVENGTLYINKLIVQPEMQRQGIGSGLLAELERICTHERAELFTSSKSQSNIELYQRSGYEIFKEQEISKNLKFVYLEK